jgi:hypothetical protein
MPTITISHFSVAGPHAGNATGLTHQAIDHDAQTYFDTLCTMFRLVEMRQRFARYTGQYALKSLDNRHLLAELGEHRRGLKADITSSDDHYAPTLSSSPKTRSASDRVRTV